MFCNRCGEILTTSSVLCNRCSPKTLTSIKTDNTQVILNLEQENTQLKARNARLEDFVRELNKSLRANAVINYGLDYGVMLKESSNLLNETPQQSLVEMQAMHIEKEIEWIHVNYPHLDGPHLGILLDRAKQLRASVKDDSNE